MKVSVALGMWMFAEYAYSAFGFKTGSYFII